MYRAFDVRSFVLVMILSLTGTAAFADDLAVELKLVGYTALTFRSSFSPKTVDTLNSKRQGFMWYPWDLYGMKSNPAALVFNADGSVTMSGDSTKAHGQLVTLVKHTRSPYFVGTGFGGGGYIEAEIKYDPEDVEKYATTSWPAFWALQTEGNIFPGTGDWPNQGPGYLHNIEVDIFEGMKKQPTLWGQTYGACLHEWYGVYKRSCPEGLCDFGMPFTEGQRALPPTKERSQGIMSLPAALRAQTQKKVDLTQYHRYGILWVPATKQAQGYVRFYFDGMQAGPEKRWAKYEGQPPPPAGQPWAYGILDQRHLFLILGTGLRIPMTVKAVTVWQKGNQDNIVN